MKICWFNKCLVLLIVLSFLVTAVSPSFSINIVDKSVDSELVEFTTEVRGNQGFGDHSIKLTKQESVEVMNLINDIKRQLDNIKSKNEAVDIFDNAIVELNRFGLLGDLTIEQAQKLVTSMYIKSKLKQSYKNDNNTNGTNVLCLIAGRTNYTLTVRPINPWLLVLNDYVYEYGLKLYEKYPLLILLSPLWWMAQISIMILWSITGSRADRMPISLFHVFGIGFYYDIDKKIYYAPGWVNSIGSYGTINWDGELLGNLKGIKIPYDPWPLIVTYPAVRGFCGIKIWLNEDGSEKFYMGSALAVGLDVKE